MSALQKLLGLDGIDFAAIGEGVQQGIGDYNRKLDLILAALARIEARQGNEHTNIIPHNPESGHDD